MASGFASGLIQQVQIDDPSQLYNIASTAFGVCSTRANVKEKTAQIAGFELIQGTTVYIQFAERNAVMAPTLNINEKGARNIVLADGSSCGTNDANNGWYPGAVVMLTFDGSNWVRDQSYNVNDSVEQKSISTNNQYPILLKHSESLNDEIDKVNYTHNVTINPSTGILSAAGFSGSGANLTNIPFNSIDFSNNKITNSMLENDNVTVAGRIWELGDTITAQQLRQDLGLSQIMRFIGIVAQNSEYVPSDGTNGTPTIIGLSSYTPEIGDVVINESEGREYVYTPGNTWELLGQDASTVYSVSLSDYERITNISQNTDRTISITKTSIGILPIAYGGTGASSFNANEVIISSTPGENEAMTLISKAYKVGDSNNHSAILNSSQAFVTEDYIYYGLPTINGIHNYTANTTLFAPVTSGTNHALLISNSSGNNGPAPIWTTLAFLNENTSTTTDERAYTSLVLGNDVSVTSTSAHSEGRIELYSADQGKHILVGESATTKDYEHILPNADGYLVKTANLTQGQSTQPVWINNGIVTALTYTANRLYYSASTTSFEPTNHYANTTQLILNIPSGTPQSTNDTLYVNGATYFNGDVKHNGTTYFKYDSNPEHPSYYYIDQNAVGYLNTLQVNNIRLMNSSIEFYQFNVDLKNNSNNPLYGSITTIQDKMSFNISKSAATIIPSFSFNGDLEPDNTNSQVLYSIGTIQKHWKHAYLHNALLVGEQNQAIADYTDSSLLSYVGPGFMSANIIPASTETGVPTNSGYYLIGSGIQYGHLYIKRLGKLNESIMTTGQAVLELGNNLSSTIENNAYGIVRLYNTNVGSAEYTATGWTGSGISDFTILGATSTEQNVAAWSTLILGNDKNVTTTDPHSQGLIRIYSKGTVHTDIQSQVATSGSHTVYLPKYGNDMFLTHVGDNNAVGSGTQPVYVAENGRITASTNTVGDAYTPVYSNEGVLTPTAPVQYNTFTIIGSDNQVELKNDAYTEDTYVLTIVITSGEANINAPITWTSSTGKIKLQTGDVAVSGDVSGYILTARGISLVN